VESLPRVAGIDPGTVSFGLVVLEHAEVVQAETFATQDLAADTTPLLEALTAGGPLELICGPSGYGVPLRRATALTARDRELLTLVLPRERGRQVGIGGLGRLLDALALLPVPTILLPGVRHLSTVPAHRKANRIDMGTADKLCAAAMALWHYHEMTGLPLAACSLLMLELGGAFTAAVAVAGGAIVDGLGGTSGPPGFLAGGAMDGEVAYWLGPLSKQTLFTGGVADMAGLPEPSLAGFLAGVEAGDPACLMAREAYLEGIEKAVAALLVSAPAPQAVYLSGRMAQAPQVFAEVARRVDRRLPGRVPVTFLPGPGGEVKEAALGAAMLADGLAGGTFAPLVEALRLREAAGEVVDQIYFRRGDAP
jgi:predicted butyrate kinase (DUF1464 family)